MYKYKIARKDYDRVWMGTIGLSVFILQGCQGTVSGTSDETKPASASSSLSALTEVSATVTGMSSASNTTSFTATYTPTSGKTYTSFTVDLGSGFQATNICTSATIFGLSGTGNCVSSFMLLNSNIFRDASGSVVAQISQNQELSYGSTALPAGYYEIPRVMYDDDGFNNADNGCNSSGGVNFCTSVKAITSSQHAAFVDCGTTQTTVVDRIANCALQNGPNATWNGEPSGNQGEGVWKLVTRNGANLEVWQDQRTGLLWSSKLGSDNWCKASGNIENLANINCQATYNPSSQSYCVESGRSAVALGDNYGTSTYSTAKGGMGAGSSPKVMWRLPTATDFKQADINGIRRVLPDMGVGGAGSEWTSTLASYGRDRARTFDSLGGGQALLTRSSNATIRCVGR